MLLGLTQTHWLCVSWPKVWQDGGKPGCCWSGLFLVSEDVIFSLSEQRQQERRSRSEGTEWNPVGLESGHLS